ncbi:MATE family efflux transporter [Albirhodobacter sp. R86504]|uniref:MATE family efflux transporter n=1 Tax=Albirhodobacter sp. R86504 TaxID=3093848 RepID=UPI00367011DE
MTQPAASAIPSRAITHRRVLAIAAPIVLSNVTVPLLGAVDTGVVGQLGAAAPIGAVGLAAVILTSIYWIFGFLRMGTTGLTAQAVGAKTGAAARDEVAATLQRALMIALAAGILMVLLQVPLIDLAFRIAPASGEVEDLARAYLAIRIWGAPATIALYALNGWLIGSERTGAVLMIQLAMNGLNVGLDLLFVLGFGWGVEGVAIATLISELGGAAIGLWLCRAALFVRLGGLLDAVALREMARVNTDIMIRSILLQASFTSFMFLGAGQGDQTLAANQVLMQFLSITAYALDGFAFAAESLIGQAVGARAPAQVLRAVKVTGAWGVIGAAGLGVSFFIAGPWIIDLMTTAPLVRETAREFLPWLVVAPLIGVTSWMLDGVFIGATLTREMRNAMVVSALVYAMAVIVLEPFGNHGLWAALMVLNAVRGATMFALFPRALRKAQGSP